MTEDAIEEISLDLPNKNVEINEYSRLQTGDIVLFKANAWYCRILECIQRSDYSHVGIIMRDPWYISSDLRGLYILTASYDEQKKLGIDVHPLLDIIGLNSKNIFVVKVNGERESAVFEARVAHFYYQVRNIPADFDSIDWLSGLLFMDAPAIKTGLKNDTGKSWRFYGCALVAYFCVTVCWVSNTLDWSLISPIVFCNREIIEGLPWTVGVERIQPINNFISC